MTNLESSFEGCVPIDDIDPLLRSGDSDMLKLYKTLCLSCDEGLSILFFVMTLTLTRGQVFALQ